MTGTECDLAASLPKPAFCSPRRPHDVRHHSRCPFVGCPRVECESGRWGVRDGWGKCKRCAAAVSWKCGAVVCPPPAPPLRPSSSASEGCGVCVCVASFRPFLDRPVLVPFSQTFAVSSCSHLARAGESRASCSPLPLEAVVLWRFICFPVHLFCLSSFFFLVRCATPREARFPYSSPVLSSMPPLLCFFSLSSVFFFVLAVVWIAAVLPRLHLA